MSQEHKSDRLNHTDDDFDDLNDGLEILPPANIGSAEDEDITPTPEELGRLLAVWAFRKLRPRTNIKQVE